MRYGIFILTLLTLACQQSAPKTAPINNDMWLLKDISDIGEVIEQQQTDWNKGDIKAFMKGYWHSDSLRFITKRGTRFGYDSVESNYLRHYNTPEKMGHLKFSDWEYHRIDYKGTIYNVTGKWKISGNDSADGFFSLLFRKHKEGWKIIVDHTW